MRKNHRKGYEPIHVESLPGNIEVYSVPSSDGQNIYFPCIETAGAHEVICNCRYWFEIERMGFIVTVGDRKHQCSHIRKSVELSLLEGLLFPSEPL